MKLSIFVLLIVVIIICLGCSDPTPPRGLSGIIGSNETVIGCAFLVDPCYKTIDITFDDNGSAGYHYYWVEFSGTYGCTVSRWQRLNNAGGPLTLTGVARYDDFSYLNVPEDVDVYINSCDDVKDAGKNATRGSDQLSYRVEVPVFHSDCFKSCCSDTITGKGWNYVTALLDASGVDGVKSQIKTRYGKMCGECVSSTKHSHHAVFVNISYHDSGSQLWCQHGYIKRRLPGESSWTFGSYSEIEGDYYDIKIDSIYKIPFEGTWHHYEVLLDPGSGVFTANYDYNLWHIWDPHNYWVNKRGNKAQWTAEIYPEETDMGSGANAPCSLTVAKYRIYGSYSWAEFLTNPNMSVGGTDSSKWGISRDNISLSIWDKQLLP